VRVWLPDIYHYAVFSYYNESEEQTDQNKNKCLKNMSSNENKNNCNIKLSQRLDYNILYYIIIIL